MRAVLEVSLPFWLEGSGFQAAVSTWVTRIEGTEGGSLQSTLVVIGWVAQPKETTLLGPSSHDIKDWVTCDEVSLPGYQKPVSLLAKPSRDLFPYAHWVRKSKTGARLVSLSLPTHTSVFFFLFPFATKRSNLQARAEKGSCGSQWILQAQLFPLCLGSPGTNQSTLRGSRSRSSIGQVRTYNLFYTQG